MSNMKVEQRHLRLQEFREWLLADTEVRFEYEQLRFQEEVGEALAKARREHGLTQGEVADRAGTTQSVIARLERGRGGTPSLALLDRVARAVGLKVALSLLPAPKAA